MIADCSVFLNWTQYFDNEWGLKISNISAYGWLGKSLELSKHSLVLAVVVVVVKTVMTEGLPEEYSSTSLLNILEWDGILYINV